MPQKHDQTQESVKVCNHKPGDLWDEGGCCGNIEAIAKANQTIANEVKNKQIADGETKQLIHQADNLSKFIQV